MTFERFASPADALTSNLPGRQDNSATDDLLPSVAAFSSAAIFVNTWISAPPRIAVSRDFTFKAVIGEPDW